MRPTRERSIQQHAAYFICSQTAKRQPFFRHERWALLLTETILHYAQSSYTLHAYVLMPDHIHLLIRPHETLERAMSLIKGGFSFRAKRAFNWNSEIWQQGFSDHRIRDEQDRQNHLEYIRQNPIHAHLIAAAEQYPYMAFPNRAFPPGLKPQLIPATSNVRTEARTLQHNGTGAF